nr:hypothetical protein GW17_00036002 [Ipomoea batatas]
MRGVKSLISKLSGECDITRPSYLAQSEKPDQISDQERSQYLSPSQLFKVNVIKIRKKFGSGRTIVRKRLEKVDEEFVVVWLSCDSFSNALNLARSSLDFLGPTAGACTGIWPLSIFTTETMDGLRVGDGLAHKRANLSIFSASSLE